MEIGIDIELNERFENISNHFKERVFTTNEINKAKKSHSSSQTFCSLWCAKEAVIKAFSNKNIELKNIEINNDLNGNPFVVINDTIKSELNKINLKQIKISISHTKTYSTAVCLIY